MGVDAEICDQVTPQQQQQQQEDAAPSFLSACPRSILQRILCFLPLADFLRSRPVSKRFHSVGENDAVWRAVCDRQFRAIATPFRAALDLKKRPVSDFWLPAWREFDLDDWVSTFPLPEGWTWSWLARCLLTEVPLEEESTTTPDADSPAKSDEEVRFGFRCTKDKLFIGEWRGSQREGKGVLLEAQPFRFFCGTYANNAINGPGIFVSGDGRQYSGEWINGVANGKGFKSWPEGDTYDGEWKDGDQEGSGLYRWKSGSSYNGGWKKGMKEGYGVYAWHYGSRYEGEWVGDKMEGTGTLWYDAKEYYQGGWYDGCQDGHGKYMTIFGSSYVGRRVRDRQHGLGRFTHPDGYSWEGNWTNGIPDDWENAVHPRMRSLLLEGKCTRVLTKATPFYGQILHKCLHCHPGEEGKDGNFLCETCMKHCHKKHPFVSSFAVNVETIWTLGRSWCSCPCEKA